MSEIEDLAEFLHHEKCYDDYAGKCKRWETDHMGHRSYYQDRAKVIYEKLEPEVGSANVTLACQVIIDEFLS